MIDGIQNIQSPPGAPGSCAPQTNAQSQPPDAHGSQPVDTVQISEQGREKLNSTIAEATGMPEDENLSADEKREVEHLKKTDQEVKTHERAHMSGGAGLVMGGASYQFQRGPDGRMYAVSGEVKIDTSRERDPKDTIRKMQQVKRAALAPSHPSGQDRSVAARASQVEAEARIELQKQRAEEEKAKKADDKESNGLKPAGSQNAYTSSCSEPTINVIA